VPFVVKKRPEYQTNLEPGKSLLILDFKSKI